MRIGVDIDGVLNYRTRFVFECGAKYCVESGKGSLQDSTSEHVSKVYGWDRATRDDFWYKYGALQCFVWPAQNFAAEVIRKLRADGHEVWIITGRNNGDMRVDGMPEGANWEDVTRGWLAENEIEHDGLAFDLGRPAPNDKGTFCRENGVDLMVEDLPYYLEGFDEQTKVFIFDQPYNRKVSLENAERVYSWYDIYDKIKEMA